MRSHQLPRPLRPRTLLACLAIATALLAVTADVAQASLFLVFDRTSGSPGTIVHVRTAGNGACTVCPGRLPLYFAGAEVADGIRSADDPGLVQVGSLNIDDHANGSGLFTVPEVTNGRYVVMTFCEPCAQGSAGRVMLPLGPFPPFRVFGSEVFQSTPVWPLVVAGFIGFVLAAAVTLPLARARRRKHRRSTHDADRDERPSPSPGGI